RAYHFPVSSIKGVTGNPLSAAGPLQVAACLLAMRDGRVPPTANYEVPDPWCDLDYVPNEPRSMDLHRALVNLHGLGGGNSSLIIEQVRSASTCFKSVASPRWPPPSSSASSSS
ncbi:MAG: hypothetical protein KDL10_10620, partial [Kiritimatiellae bacterium]|nr:hypothetical protein [Kiritimatiellia bacterium]